MWKCVTRRVKDSVERAYNVLDVRRTWTCGGSGQDSIHPSNPLPSQSPASESDDNIKKLFTKSAGNERGGGSTKKPNHSKVNDERYFCPFKRRAAAKRAYAASAAAAANSNYNRSVKNPNDHQLVTFCTEQKWDRKGHEQFRKRFGHYRFQCNFQRSVLEALTWSSAIVCGWYTSQLYCMKRRNLARLNNKNPWQSKCNYARAIQSPSQAFHTNLFSHWVLAAPPPKHQNDNEETTTEKQSRFWLNANEFKWQLNCDNITSSKYAPYEINNDGKPDDDEKSTNDIINNTSTGQTNLSPTTFESAINNLFTVHSNIEYRLGIENIEAGEYSTAVQYFKLATSHQHTSATFNLGICYEQGVGVEKNLKMALECYMAAAEMGHSKAMYNVGVFYVHGLAGLKRNRKMARQYFIAAAKLGQLDAKAALGIATLSKTELKLKDDNEHQYQLQSTSAEHVGQYGSIKSLIDSGIFTPVVVT